jgi:hypothetical protein
MEISFWQQFDSINLRFTELSKSSPSIPQVAVSLENDNFTAAISPPQKCVAIEICIPESRIRKANDMDKTFFM